MDHAPFEPLVDLGDLIQWLRDHPGPDGHVIPILLGMLPPTEDGPTVDAPTADMSR